MPLAIGLTLLYLAMVARVHELTPRSRRLASRIGLTLAVVATTVLVTVYYVQFTVVPASLAHGQTDGIALLTQYNPHGLFIALEDVGYLAMALSFDAVAVAVPDRTRAARAVRWVLAAARVAVIAGLVWITITRGTDRGYLFELLRSPSTGSLCWWARCCASGSSALRRKSRIRHRRVPSTFRPSSLRRCRESCGAKPCLRWS